MHSRLGRLVIERCGRGAELPVGYEVSMTLEEAMVEVWRQALAERAEKGKPETRGQKLGSGKEKDGPRSVELGGKRFAVRETARKRLREADFVFEGQPMRALEQNPKTESRWAELARKGHKVMQFLAAGQYVRVVVDGKW
jgi:hypothetical protein